VSHADDQIARHSVALTKHAAIDTFYPETWTYRLKRVFLGKPFVSEQLEGERLSRPVALGVLSSDCISSSAYGTEEILTQLTPVIGLAAFSLLVPIMFIILGVLVLVAFSYIDVIGKYTSAGGSYVVARENFGPKVAQIAAVALLIDYVVTVAIQCSAGTAVLTSMFPSLLSYTVPITVGVILLFIYGNLRGIREAGVAFALPTYFFITMMFFTFAVGFYQKFTGHLRVLALPHASLLVDGKLGHPGHGALYGVAFVVLLRAYANGGSSLTGLEAISNGVSAFRRPESKNARVVMVAMATILGTLLLGVTFLAKWTHALPYAAGSPTVVSQVVLAVFGNTGFGHVVFYLVLFGVMFILFTGGNTSFNGFPFLANYVATDKYLPRQLTKRGHRLSFSYGILALGAVALALTIAFRAQVNALVSLYAIGVFTAFTMAGSGMAKKHFTERGRGWRRGMIINGASAFVSLIVAIIFVFVKFGEGAWVVVLLGPLMFLGLLRLHRQYEREEEAFETTQTSEAATVARQNRVVVFVDQYDLATERALHYVSTLNAYAVKAVHFDIDPVVTRELESAWGRDGSASVGVTLQIAECQDRRVDRAALEFVADIVRDPAVFCMVILPRRGFNSRLQRLLHDRTGDAIATAVTHIPRVAATIIPYRMSPTATIKAGDQGDRLSDEVERGAIREEAHLEADEKLAQRRLELEGLREIGEIGQRDVVAIAGRVSAVTLSSGEGRAVRYTLQDATGSITLVFQGRTSIPGVERGTRLVVRGTVSTQDREAVILNPGYEIVAPPAGHE
jgi:amino acid transporter